MMNLLFLCGIYPQAHKEHIFNNSKRGYQFAAQNLQEAVVNGFNANGIVPQIITFPFLSTFPFGYKKPVIRYGKVDSHCKCVNFVNIPFLKSLNTCNQDVFNWCRQFNDKEEKHILVYALSSHLMKIALKAKRKFKNVHLSIIIPDLPQYMGCNRVYKALGLKKRDNKYIQDNIKLFDSYILLTQAMTLPLGIEGSRYCIVEGIFNDKKLQFFEEINEIDLDTKIVLYSGALAQKYGIDTLLNAFSFLPNKDYRLVICGDGEAKELVEKASIRDNRILYLGKINYEKVITLQKKAALLVNPRTAEGEFTKYSFPSKTMEYFASGTPVLMHRLPGVLDQYFDYCFIIDDNSEETLAKNIDKILSLPTEERSKIGGAASKFILENKNAKKQVEKIIDIMN